ncbi:condensation domain-containing protein, partial [Allorhizocola rhizosphaerae]|uniref:condensation domain-containing protein n=1 Tax=Allorhizocola rhizosphaerae TaxID=1872709 RepID=UPI0013C2A4E3
MLAAVGAEPATILDGEPLAFPVVPVLESIAARTGAGQHRTALVHGESRMTYQELDAAVIARAEQLRADGAGPGRLVVVCQPRGMDAIVAILAVLRTGAAYLPLDPSAPQARNEAILQDACGGATPPPHTDCDGAVLPGPGVPAGVAYVIYTSGSTGTPNGVLVGHEALAHFVAGALQRYGFGPEDRVLQFAPLHFDASVEEIFVTLCAGGTLVLRTDSMLDIAGLVDGCVVHGVTVLDLPTAYWHELVYAVGAGVVELPAALRIVIIGGEAALPERVARWRECAGERVRLLNTYGPTEATVVATAAELSTCDSDEVPIGLPLPGVRAAVVEGELWLLGGGLSRGYLGRPELTARRFTTLDGQAAYRTGDLVCVREDGQLGYLGRVDDEIKISGYRIDPAAIESVLLGHAAVRQAAVVAQEHGQSKRLVAFVEAAAPVSVAELRKHLAAQLPQQAVPGAIGIVDALPRTSSGKIDKKTLRVTAPPPERAFTAEPVVDEDAIPLSYAQRRLWFLNRLEGPSSSYNVPAVLRLSGVPDRDALAAALADVVERHEVLRTVFPAIEGEPFQVILDDVRPELVTVECTPDAAPALVDAFANEPFDVSVDMPLRAKLFVTGPQESVFVLVLHHIATDGWSMGPLWRDIATAYQARLVGQEPDWEPLPVQYADYTLWQQELVSGVLTQQLDFWRETLEGAPPVLDLPADRPRPALASYDGGTVTAKLEPEVHQRLLDLSRQHRASLLMVLQAALGVALSRAGAGQDIPIGTVVAGRTDDALNDVVGFFVNT